MGYSSATVATSTDTGVYSVRITDLPAQDRPRERLRDKGANSLSNAELLAILLRTGSRGRSALHVAQTLLENRDLHGLVRASLTDLKRAPGVGEVKAIQIAAAIELGKRIAALTPEARPAVNAPEDAVNLLMPDMRFLAVEEFRMVMLDSRNNVLGVERVSTGTADSSMAHPRDVFRPAIAANAVAVIVAHNHPGGSADPSAEDRSVTRRLTDAGALIGIDVLDHIIIGDGRWTSMKRIKAMG